MVWFSHFQELCWQFCMDLAGVWEKTNASNPPFIFIVIRTSQVEYETLNRPLNFWFLNFGKFWPTQELAHISLEKEP